MRNRTSARLLIWNALSHPRHRSHFRIIDITRRGQNVAIRMNVSYLLIQYPTVAHTYLLRELRGLHDLGWDILPVSIRPPDRPSEALSAAERTESERTFYVLSGGAGALLADQLRVFLTRPTRYLSGMAYALRLGGFDLRECLCLL